MWWPWLLPVGGTGPAHTQALFLAAKAPHFSRLGDVEVNAGQNASFQCMAAGRAVEAERFLLQVRGAGTLSGWGRLLGPGFSLRGAESLLHFPAPLLMPPCPHLGSALPSWVLLYPQDRAGLQDPQTTLHQRQRPHSLNQLLIPHLPVAELVPGTPYVPCVLGTAKWGQDIDYSPRPGQSEIATLPLGRS